MLHLTTTSTTAALATEANVSSVTAVVPRWVHLVQMSAFGVGSFFATTNNLLVIATFLWSPSLRRSAGLCLLGYLAVFDLCIGLGAVAEIAAQYRAYTGWQLTKLQCLGEFSLIVFGVLGSSFFVLFIAIDRLWALKYPMMYKTKNHARIALVSAVVVGCLAGLFASAQFVGITRDTKLIYCNPTVCWSKSFHTLFSASAMFNMTSMSVLYVCLAAISWRANQRLQHAKGSLLNYVDKQRLRLIRRQSRLNQIITTTVTVYLFLWLTPNLVSLTAQHLKAPAHWQMVLGCMIGLCQTVNASINVVIYTVKSRQFSAALHALVHRRRLNSMTPSITMSHSLKCAPVVRRALFDAPLSHSHSHSHSQFNSPSHQDDDVSASEPGKGKVAVLKSSRSHELHRDRVASYPTYRKHHIDKIIRCRRDSDDGQSARLQLPLSVKREANSDILL